MRQRSAWLLEESARKTRHGKLRACAVLEGERRLIGWYLYYARAGGVSEVVQVAARNGSFGRVLQRLLVDGLATRAAAVRGRLDPRHLRELSGPALLAPLRGYLDAGFTRATPNSPAAIHQGSAFLSRLEGEWWLRFQGR